MKKTLTSLICIAVVLGVWAETVKVKEFEWFGPYPLSAPFVLDSLDVSGKKATLQSLSPAPDKISPSGVRSRITPSCAPSSESPSLNILSFSFDNSSYASPQISIEGISDYTLYIDGKKTLGNTVSLKPATHRVDIRYVSDTAPSDSLSVKIVSPTDAGIEMRNDGKRNYSLLDVLHGPRVVSVEISPDGRYIMAGYSHTADGGAVTHSGRVFSLPDGKLKTVLPSQASWMPKGSAYIFTEPGIESVALVSVDASTGERKVLCNDFSGYLSAIAPDGSYAVVTDWNEGRREDPDTYMILEPEDRQPGWRTRPAISVIDFATGLKRPVTFGHRNVTLNDVSPDSKRLLLTVSNSRLEKRPTTVFSIIDLNLETMKGDTVVFEDGFIGSAVYSPDGKKILVRGNPEALGGIGRNVPEGRVPSMMDMQLYTIDIASGNITPLTKDFNPNVGKFVWNRGDGKVYFTAEDRDCLNMFKLDPTTGRITKLPLAEELVKGFSISSNGRTGAYFGESAASPNALYSLDMKTLKSSPVSSPNAENLEDVRFGSVEGWDFVNSKGDKINGRFYLPPNFDPSKKYPMIVNYYGGCSPTSRNFESRYPHHAYAAQGYVVYVLNPSGATGFGQEFSSRHVNTAGEGVADDIIEGTKEFIRQHPFVDETKIGCIGASYGGFMTQYLQTVTDIFAAAVSHAGISDHTSYWGEGYWGYSYSEVSMGNSYPWSETDLYVKQSPLYRADKINTPILFLHGDHDNNVPFGESIQMFTALKLLGKPTAFVAVSDQDHQILDYGKRKKWQDTIFAWFSKYLKDDPAWWDALYPPVQL